MEISVQYKLAAEIIDRSRDRRQRDNRFFLGILIGIMSLTGYVLKNNLLESNSSGPALLVILLDWIIICALWQTDLILYNRSNAATFRVLRQIEHDESEIFSLFVKTYQYLNLGEDGCPLLFKHRSVSLTRRSLPLIMCQFGITCFFLIEFKGKVPCPWCVYSFANLLVYALFRRVIKEAGA